MPHPAGRLAMAAATLAATVLAAASPAQAGPRVHEWPIRAEWVVLNDLALGADGALYASDGSLGRLYRISTRTGRVTSTDVGESLRGVTTGPDGALWVTDGSLDRVSRIAADGSATHHDLPTRGSFPVGIVSGPDRALWFTELRGDRIGRITTSGQITEYDIPTPGAFTADITVGPDGALWFTEQSTDKVGRVSTAGVVTEYALPAGSLPGPIVSAGGALHVALRNTNAIVELSTAGEILDTRPLPTENANPLSMTVSPNGKAIHVAQQSASSIATLRTDGGPIREIALRSQPDDLAFDADGDLWYIASDDRRVGRIQLGR